MSVIISDFEVIPEVSTGETAEDETPAPAAPLLQPIDVVAIVRRQQHRDARLRAH